MIRHVWVASPGAGRIDAALAQALPLSRSRIQALLKDGQVTVDGVIERTARRALRGGEEVVLLEPPPPPSGLVAQDLGVPVLHLDDEVIVVDKPADLVVHPAKGHHDGTLVNALLHLIGAAVIDDGEHPTDPSRPGVVHRLDRGTSGVMVVTRTPAALTHLGAQFAAHSVERAYLAVVWGRPAAAGTVDAPLGRHPVDRQRHAVLADGGRRAVTHYEVLGEHRFGAAGDPQGRAVSLVRCRLETGRTHQIRVHMRHIGHPLVGDPLYGPSGPPPGPLREALEGLDRQLLHAQVLGFTHPRTGDRLRFATAPPPDMGRVLAELGLLALASP